MSLTEDLSRPAHLLGNGAPVTEELTLTELRVSGAIPKELDGTARIRSPA
jgi:carotenoid cleavage dioxygenase-like enzyme